METAIEQEFNIRPGVGRFAELLSTGSCNRAPFDHILLETRGCVVTPTLGSILPYWLLVVPRAPFVNFHRWAAQNATTPHELVAEVLSRLGVDTDRTLWFEHGPADYGSLVGCGVDHAHLHLIVDPPFLFDEFVSTVISAADIRWRARLVTEAYQTIGESSYLVAAFADRAITAERVDRVGSQFFRRVVATLTHQPHAWNYKIHPHMGNVQQTIRAFSRRAA